MGPSPPDFQDYVVILNWPPQPAGCRGFFYGRQKPDLDRSEGEALPHQRNTGDATDDRNGIHGSKENGLNAGAADDAPVVRFTAIGVSAYDTSMACQPCVHLGVRRTHSSTKLQCWTGFISE